MQVRGVDSLEHYLAFTQKCFSSISIQLIDVVQGFVHVGIAVIPIAALGYLFTLFSLTRNLLLSSIDGLQLSTRTSSARPVVVTVATAGYERPAFDLVQLLRTVGRYEGDIVILTDAENFNFVREETKVHAWADKVDIVNAVEAFPPPYKAPPLSRAGSITKGGTAGVAII